MPSPRQLRRLVAHLLGREPVIAFRISQSCPSGWPAVIRSEAYDPAGRPNPNLYYLVCPHLRRALARLEDRGFVKELEKRISSDPELAGELKKAQRQHALEWQSDATAGRQQGIPGRIEVSPPLIAASGNELLLKCLHAHFAWFLSHPGYRIGEIIAGELGESPWCPDEMCRETYRKMEER